MINSKHSKWYNTVITFSIDIIEASAVFKLFHFTTIALYFHSYSLESNVTLVFPKQAGLLYYTKQARYFQIKCFFLDYDNQAFLDVLVNCSALEISFYIESWYFLSVSTINIFMMIAAPIFIHCTFMFEMIMKLFTNVRVFPVSDQAVESILSQIFFAQLVFLH